MIRTLFFVLLFAGSTAFAQQTPHAIATNPHRLEALKALYASGASDTRSIVHSADKALGMEAPSVTMKTQAPEGGSLHDYVSLAPYWWPDPSKKNGLPYIRRDGEVNPEREQYHDRDHFGKLVSAVEALGTAYALTGDERYAGGAAHLVSVWFLDSATYMNPSLNYAQAIRGRNDGRGAGLIEMHMLPRVLEAVVRISGSKAWPREKQQAMEDWCSRYYAWLTTSRIGRDEMKAPNNHGSWYDVQRTALLVFLGRIDEARKIIEAAKTSRIASEIEPDGTQPKELVRTKSMGYCTFNLSALSTLAVIGSNVGVDLWHFATKDGRGIRRAIDYMVPFYQDRTKWTSKQIVDFDLNEAIELLETASPYYDGAYDGVIAALAMQASHTKQK